MERARNSIHEHSQLKLTCDVIRLQDQLADQQASIEGHINDIVDHKLREREKSESNTDRSSDIVDKLEETLARLTERATNVPTSPAPAPHVTLLSRRIDQRLEEINGRIEKHDRALEDEKSILDEHAQDVITLKEENAQLKMQSEDLLQLVSALKEENAQAQLERKDILALKGLIKEESAQLEKQCAEVLALKGSINEKSSALLLEGNKASSQASNGQFLKSTTWRTLLTSISQSKAHCQMASMTSTSEMSERYWVHTVATSVI